MWLLLAEAGLLPFAQLLPNPGAGKKRLRYLEAAISLFPRHFAGKLCTSKLAPFLMSAPAEARALSGPSFPTLSWVLCPAPPFGIPFRGSSSRGR